ncbi:MAG TPA: alpha/beta fold hydrolase [Polyangiaceae bacterium]
MPKIDKPSSDWGDATEAALNAVIGDYLERRGNTLAIPMALHDRGRPLPLSREALGAARPAATPKIVVFVHGMACTEACWSYLDDPSVSYGSQLERDLGFTAYYVRYNTGRHVSENGRDLALLLEQLIRAHPVAPFELTLVGHSMGGLVIRSACHYADELGLRWIELARRAIYLGTPHLGSPLEKAGHLVSVALTAIPNPVVKLTASLAKLRSSGVKDLRHGSLRDEDWKERDLDAFDAARPLQVPLRPGLRHYWVAGTLIGDETHLLGQLFGDALVRIGSATHPGLRIDLPTDQVAVFPGVAHIHLARHPAVYARLKVWCGDACEQASCPTDDPRSSPDGTPPAPRDRLLGYRALVEESIDKGASAVQEIQEEFTMRPYALLEQIPPIAAPAKAVRRIHFTLLRTSYAMVRLANRWVGATLETALQRRNEERRSKS